MSDDYPTKVDDYILMSDDYPTEVDDYRVPGRPKLGV